jgi:hypothetical protein
VNRQTTTAPRFDWRSRREQLRLAAALVVITAFVALAVLAIAASRTSLSLGAPAPALAHRTQTPAGADAGAPPPAAIASSALGPSGAADPSSDAAESVPSSGAAGPNVAVPSSLLPPPALGPGSTGLACPALALLPPDDVGGLQSLVALIPLFGPLSPEAFALLPAFEPGFTALGPLFPAFGEGLDAAAPVLTPLTPVVQQLSQAGFATLAPLYDPSRPQVLAYERQLAAELQPAVAALATAPGSECLVDLEGVLASILV